MNCTTMHGSTNFKFMLQHYIDPVCHTKFQPICEILWKITQFSPVKQKKNVRASHSGVREDSCVLGYDVAIGKYQRFGGAYYIHLQGLCSPRGLHRFELIGVCISHLV